MKNEFPFILNNNIKKYLEINNDKLPNQEKLSIFEKYNPYCGVKDKNDNERYKNNRETSIFNNIQFSTTKVFKETFKNMNFEIMFKDN